jgi:hypothetical protein
MLANHVGLRMQQGTEERGKKVSILYTGGVRANIMRANARVTHVTNHELDDHLIGCDIYDTFDQCD